MNPLPLWRIGSLIFFRTEVANAMELECRNFLGLDVRLKPTEFDVSQQVRRWSFCCYFHMMTQDHQAKIFVLRLLVFRSPMWPRICCACNYDSLWCFSCLISTSKRCQCACWKPSPVNVCVPGRFSTKIRRNGLTIWWSSQMWMQFGWQKKQGQITPGILITKPLLTYMQVKQPWVPPRFPVWPLPSCPGQWATPGLGTKSLVGQWHLPSEGWWVLASSVASLLETRWRWREPEQVSFMTYNQIYVTWLHKVKCWHVSAIKKP